MGCAGASRQCSPTSKPGALASPEAGSKSRIDWSGSYRFRQSLCTGPFQPGQKKNTLSRNAAKKGGPESPTIPVFPLQGRPAHHPAVSRGLCQNTQAPGGVDKLKGGKTGVITGRRARTIGGIRRMTGGVSLVAPDSDRDGFPGVRSIGDRSWSFGNQMHNLTCAFDPTRHTQQSPGDHRLAEPLTDLAPHHHIGDTGFILQRRKDRAGGGARAPGAMTRPVAPRPVVSNQPRHAPGHVPE